MSNECKFLVGDAATKTVEKTYKLLRYATAYAEKNGLDVFDENGVVIESYRKVEESVKEVKEAIEDVVDAAKDVIEDAADELCDDETHDDFEDHNVECIKQGIFKRIIAAILKFFNK